MKHKVKSKYYLNMLNSCLLPIVSQQLSYEELFFAQDGATRRFPLPLCMWLYKYFSGRWIGRGGTRLMVTAKPRSYSA